MVLHFWILSIESKTISADSILLKDNEILQVKCYIQRLLFSIIIITRGFSVIELVNIFHLYEWNALV